MTIAIIAIAKRHDCRRIAIIDGRWTVIPYWWAVVHWLGIIYRLWVINHWRRCITITTNVNA
jgi:hypothetical protein